MATTRRTIRMPKPDRSYYEHPLGRIGQGDSPDNEVFTPNGPQLQALIWEMYAVYGSWRKIADLSLVDKKALRTIRNGKRKAVGLRLLDKLTVFTGIGYVQDFPWFTAEDLVALGVWRETQYVEGLKRVKGDRVILRSRKNLEREWLQRARRVPTGKGGRDGNEFFYKDGHPTPEFEAEMRARHPEWFTIKGPKKAHRPRGYRK